MALIQEVKAVCDSLAGSGWRDLLLQFGLDISAPNLKKELGRKLPALGGNRASVPGFEDFSLRGVRGVEPGVPDRSLLFHALASPAVVRNKDGSPLAKFPTPRQIEAVENYIYSLNNLSATPAGFKGLVQRLTGLNPANPEFAVVVFAQEYRNAGQTPRRLEAGMCFSRTGVSRVGSEDLEYSAPVRGYLPVPAGRPDVMCVLPARYAAYLAWRAPGKGPLFGPMQLQPDDPQTRFWVPIHKLFAGPECLKGKNLKLVLKSAHVNEKLRRIHLQPGFGVLNVANPKLDAAPFVQRDGDVASFASAASMGSGLLRPKPQPLVEAVKLGGKTLAFKVPLNSETLSSSLTIPADKDFRHAPEYVHARHRLEGDGSISDLNDPAVEPDIEAAVVTGGYFAVHYIDHTGDGWVTVELGPDLGLPVLQAYSLVTAPDFFFDAGQREMTEWRDDTTGKIPPPVSTALRSLLWVPNTPDALSAERRAANLQLNLFGAGFDPGDVTMSAVVGLPLPDRLNTHAPEFEPNRHEWLPDAASGVFAPGWDCSVDVTDGEEHMTAYGLGSPFPEDAKLCAALSAFWPAVAPDVARVFEPNATGRSWPTMAPLTDEEVGMVGNQPVDGYPGPHLLASGKEVEYQAFARADYVESALKGRFTMALTSKVTSEAYRTRVQRMARVYKALKSTTEAKRAEWAVLSFRAASPVEPELFQAQQQTGVALMGEIHRFQLYRHGSKAPAGRKVRVGIKAGTMTTLYVDDLRILHQQAGGAWSQVVL